MKKIGLVTDVLFWNSSAGDEKRIDKLIRDLSATESVIIMFIGNISRRQILIIEEKYKVKLYLINNRISHFKVLIKKIINKKFPFLRPFFIMLKKPVDLQSYYNNENKILVENIVKNENVEIILVEYIWLAYLAVNLPICKILDTHDIQADRCESYKRNNKSYHLKISIEEEIAVLNSFDYVLTISERDKMILDKCLKKPTVYIPYFNPIKNIEHKKDPILKIAFIGSAIEFNIDAIVWFVENVWDEIIKDCKDIQLNVYGAVSAFVKTNKNKNIKSHGFVNDVEDVYTLNNLMINPIRMGGGLKIKNIEALSYSMPLITTEIGAQGLEGGKNRAFLIANNKEEFIQIIRKIYLQRGFLDLLIQESKLFYYNFVQRQSSILQLIHSIPDITNNEKVL